MRKKFFLLIDVIVVLSFTGCVKETYNMNMLSKKAHLSPTMAISAVKGDITLGDIVKTNDTVVFDQNKLVILVFKKDSVVDLKLTDFSKGTILRTATIDPSTFDLDIADILNHISGTIKFLSPSIKFNYTNSFPDPIKINLNVSGKRGANTIALNLAPYTLSKPNIPVQQEITDSIVIDNLTNPNSNLPALISLPPEIINYSGTAVMTSTTKDSQPGEFVLGPNRLLGSLEVDVPMDLEINNLQFADTVDNFIKSDNSQTDDPLKPENFQLLRINVSAKNGFPLGVSLKMCLYNSATDDTLRTIKAKDILKPAPVDNNGKANGVTETTTSIEFTKVFFSSVNKADKIIFWFTLNTTGGGTQEVKIYSDYRINFKASLVVKPDINLK
ncbi:MAG TPA: hypothetical protein VF346_10325 [Bacteroidales bacterium]